jgi:hypothetical protein
MERIQKMMQDSMLGVPAEISRSGQEESGKPAESLTMWFPCCGLSDAGKANRLQSPKESVH